MTKKIKQDKYINLVEWSAIILTCFTVDGQRTMTVCVKHIRCAGARKSPIRFADKMKRLTKTNVSLIASTCHFTFFISWETFDIHVGNRWTGFRQEVYTAAFSYQHFMKLICVISLKKKMHIIVLLWLLNDTEYLLFHSSTFKWYG